VEEDQQHSGMTPSAETRRVPASWTELAGLTLVDSFLLRRLM